MVFLVWVQKLMEIFEIIRCAMVVFISKPSLKNRKIKWVRWVLIEGVGNWSVVIYFYSSKLILIPTIAINN